MISIDLSETAQKAHWKSETKFSPRQNPRIFFLTKSFLIKIFSQQKKKNCQKKNSQILSWTEFCLGLNLSQTEFCLGLHTTVVQ